MTARTTRHDDGPEQTETRLRLSLLGSGLDAAELEAEALERFPALRAATVERIPMAGTIEGTLAGRLTHEVLDVLIDQHGVEQARAHVLAELASQGLDGDAQIEVEEDEGKRRVEVRIEARPPTR